MDIGEVARESGVPASTLRYYEKRGLIQSSGRHGLRRLFPPGVLQRLALISLGRRVGFSLDEIGQMFTPNGPELNRELLSAKANELDRQIKVLTSMRDGLRHAAVCEAPSHFECPQFLRILKIVSKARHKPVNKLLKNIQSKSLLSR